MAFGKQAKSKCKRVSSSKSLGVYIDERLVLTEQIDRVSKKISSAIGGLK